MSSNATWRDQYERMLRTHLRLRSMASGYGELHLTADGGLDVSTTSAKMPTT
jgi:hypothetical protein